MEMYMTSDDAGKAVAKATVSSVYGYFLGRAELRFTTKHGMKRTTRYLTWATKPKTVVVSYVVGVAMQLTVAELAARAEAGVL